MTVAELHEILDDKNKKITLKEFQRLLWEMQKDANEEHTKYEFNDKEFQWYCGEMNGFQLALDLSEHIEEEQEGK